MDKKAATFTEALENGDNSRYKLNRELLELEKARFGAEKKEGAMEREERKKVREKASKLQLHKFRHILDRFRNGQLAAPSGPSKHQDSVDPL